MVGLVRKLVFLVPTSPTKLGTFSTGGLCRSQWFSKKKENVADVALLTSEDWIFHVTVPRRAIPPEKEDSP